MTQGWLAYTTSTYCGTQTRVTGQQMNRHMFHLR
jgi:hypothetical protein